jgi:hypothetical protein
MRIPASVSQYIRLGMLFSLILTAKEIKNGSHERLATTDSSVGGNVRHGVDL